jgi:HD superfamily phosphohydrolase
MTHLVYPGALHTRFHHALGAMHLMKMSIETLRSKGQNITPEEEEAVTIAILLHDIGHGPFSHALEHTIVEGISHEDISQLLMGKLNQQFGGRLTMAIDIFNGSYKKDFLHQMVSSQLDMDRLDYLNRDSFFTGVSEGVISSDRIIKMLNVKDDHITIEEKGIYSIEKFLVARRLMYWQVYLHKTVLSAEQMLQRIIKRAKFIGATCSEPLNSFINTPIENVTLEQFCSIDDFDVMMAIKQWCNHQDIVLATLCKGIIDRHLLKVRYQSEPISEKIIKEKTEATKRHYNLSEDEVQWLVYTGEASSSTYNFENETIKILFKDGSVKDITEVDNALITENLSGKVKKYYICHPA